MFFKDFFVVWIFLKFNRWRTKRKKPICIWYIGRHEYSASNTLHKHTTHTHTLHQKVWVFKYIYHFLMYFFIFGIIAEKKQHSKWMNESLLLFGFYYYHHPSSPKHSQWMNGKFFWKALKNQPARFNIIEKPENHHQNSVIRENIDIKQYFKCKLHHHHW